MAGLLRLTGPAPACGKSITFRLFSAIKTLQAIYSKRYHPQNMITKALTTKLNNSIYEVIRAQERTLLSWMLRCLFLATMNCKRKPSTLRQMSCSTPLNIKWHFIQSLKDSSNMKQTLVYIIARVASFSRRTVYFQHHFSYEGAHS